MNPASPGLRQFGAQFRHASAPVRRIAQCDERIEEGAALFVDGRYTEQVKTEADASVFEFRQVPEEPPSEWVAQRLKPDDKLGYDPRLHTPEAVARYTAACEKAGASSSRSTSTRSTRSGRSTAPAAGDDHAHKLRFAGESAPKKISRVRLALGSSQGLLISDPHNLAWLFNIRGSDVSYTPLPIGWAYLPLEGRPVVFLDGRKLTPASRQALSRHADVLEPELSSRLSRIWAGKARASPSTLRPSRPI